MWPFSPRAELKRADSEQSLEERMRFLEREVADLHARYRRLRAAQAAEASHLPHPPPAEPLVELPGESSGLSVKDQLRHKHLHRVSSLKGSQADS